MSKFYKIEDEINLKNFKEFAFVTILKKGKLLEVSSISSNFCALTFMTKEQAFDLNAWEKSVFKKDDEKIKELFNTNKTPQNQVIRFVSTTGELKHIQIQTKEEKNKIIMMLFDATESITEKKKIRKKLKTTTEKRNKNRLLIENTAYDIRTSMNSIIGFSTLLAEHEFSVEKRKKHGKIIRESVLKLLSTVENIMILLELDFNRIKFEFKRINIPLLIDNLEMKFRNILEDNSKLDFVVIEPENSENIDIECDVSWLTKIMETLISNSIKFTHEGTISIGYYLEALKIVFFVKDTGTGIPAEKRKYLFNCYKMQDYDSHDSTIIGLTNIKKILKKMGGNIWFESDLGEGTDFYFSLPLQLPKNEHEAQLPFIKKIKQNIDMSNLSVVIAEDDEMSFQYLYELILLKTKNIKRADNGVKLLQILKKHTPDIILLDLRMPQKDGFECLEEINKMNIKTKIIIQTAFNTKNELEKLKKLQFDYILKKPIDSETLFDMFKKI
jgi:signal transduction histidine kinase